MQRNGVISLRLVLGSWQRVLGSAYADREAAYGCVDWFLYEDGPRGARAGDAAGGSLLSLAEPPTAEVAHAGC